MKQRSRTSVATVLCAALGLGSTQILAQGSGTGYGNSGPMDGGAGQVQGGAAGNGDTSLQTLPTEPTGAGPAYGSSPRYSWIPYTTAGFVGLGLGNGSLDADCFPGQSCEDPRGAVSIYTGGMFTPFIGMQLGYFRLDDTDRNGGSTRISGVNISLLGVAPMGTQFSLIGRIGGTYGWTDVTAGPGVPVPVGDSKGFVPAYGVGVSWDFHRNVSLTLDWDRHHLKYPGDKRDTDVATIGLKYRF